eukprot:TRINITY_DN16529_c0_g1_i1.p1 TRINITY_DN16529_c0_g1~~TRINITY_DN16529_c0_g1_i1.p1  ORF type:complete len:181 (+),score=18.67 TRINITY_DN16529_c0_g1_i1:36-578(+)
MGNWVSSLFSRFWGQSDIRILILGLDGAGKTTILYKLYCGEVVSTIPTIGFNVETVTHKNLRFQVWDLGGQSSIRPYWRCYYQSTNAIIFVIDSADPERLNICKEELDALLKEEDLVRAPLLIMANKQDLSGALSEAEVSEALSLTLIKDREWSIYKTSAVQGIGLYDGLEWLSNSLRPQ